MAFPVWYHNTTQVPAKLQTTFQDDLESVNVSGLRDSGAIAGGYDMGHRELRAGATMRTGENSASCTSGSK
jgi:hypothetical protein